MYMRTDIVTFFRRGNSMDHELNDNSTEHIVRSAQGFSPGEETERNIINAAEECAENRSAHTPQTAQRWRIMRKAAAVLMAAALITGALAVYIATRPYDTVVSGMLEVMDSSGLVQIAPGERIPEHAVLAAATKTVCRLRHGSEMKIDRNSICSIQEPERGERARVRLDKGRIFLRVSNVPGGFTVYGRNGMVKVKGTIFGVEEHGTETAVSVFKGRVALESSGTGLELTNGQSGKAEGNTPPLLTDVDPNLALLWAREQTVFSDAPLGTVLDWIEKNSSYTCSIDPALRNRRITITIADDHIMDVFDVLFAVCGIGYEVDGYNVTAHRKNT